MNLSHKITIPAPKEKVWSFLLDIPRVGRCIPGVERVEAVGDDRYEGTVKQRVGPIGVTLTGILSVVEKDESAGRAILQGEGADRKIGGNVRAKMSMSLRELSPSETELQVDTDVNVLGKLGEFGGAVIKKKADQSME